MVGHYWLRAPELSPEPALSAAVAWAFPDPASRASLAGHGKI